MVCGNDGLDGSTVVEVCTAVAGEGELDGNCNAGHTTYSNDIHTNNNKYLHTTYSNDIRNNIHTTIDNDTTTTTTIDKNKSEDQGTLHSWLDWMQEGVRGNCPARRRRPVSIISTDTSITCDCVGDCCSCSVGQVLDVGLGIGGIDGCVDVGTAEGFETHRIFHEQVKADKMFHENGIACDHPTTTDGDHDDLV